MQYVYVLKLEQNKWYVGRSSDPVNRLLAHFDKGGSAWTRHYPPLQIHEVRPTRSPLDEDHVTEEYMMKYGVENVRGGSYSQLELPAPLLSALERKMLHADDLCLRCGSRDHFITSCPEPEPCERCGRASHLAQNCYAKTHVNGGPPQEPRAEKPRKSSSQSQSSFDQDDRDVPIKGKKGQKRASRNYGCSRCGRDSHTDDNCYATSHVNGHVFVSEESSESSSEEEEIDVVRGRCYRCRRFGHMASTCYAKTDSNGQYLG